MRKIGNQNMDRNSFEWEDVFYIYNLNDGTVSHRGKQKEKWYNLCLRPNPFYPIGRHLCLNCGMDYKGMLNMVKTYVSLYVTPERLYDSISMISSPMNRKLGRVMLEHADEWWNEFGYKSTHEFDSDIMEYVELGRHSRYYTGLNVRVKYTEDEEFCLIEGTRAEWFKTFVDKVMSFDGYTKQEFYETLSDECDISCMNEIFASLKEIGCKGIKSMKTLNMYRWIDILAPLVNEWSFVDEEDEDE